VSEAQTPWGWKGLSIFDFGLAICDSRPEDVLKVAADEDGVGGDDAADVCRYFLVASKPRAVM